MAFSVRYAFDHFLSTMMLPLCPTSTVGSIQMSKPHPRALMQKLRSSPYPGIGANSSCYRSTTCLSTVVRISTHPKPTASTRNISFSG